MPVTLKLSDEEARDLAEMLSTAATVAASNQQDGAEAVSYTHLTLPTT